MSYGFDYQFGSNGFDASGGYSEAAASGMLFTVFFKVNL